MGILANSSEVQILDNGMGSEICEFKTGSKKVLQADSARADTLTFDAGDLWIFN